MKNTIKLGAIALVLAVSFASCDGKKSTSSTDSLTKMTDTTAQKDSLQAPPPDTSKKPIDTTAKK